MHPLSGDVRINPLQFRRSVGEMFAVNLSDSFTSHHIMLVDGDPLLLVGQTIFALGILVSAIHNLNNQNVFGKLHFFRESDVLTKPLLISVIIRICGSLLVLTGIYATWGLALIIIDLIVVLVLLALRRRRVEKGRTIDVEIFACKVFATIGISIAMLDGPMWNAISGTANVVDGITLSGLSLHKAGTAIIGSAMVLFSMVLRYDLGRALEFMNRKDMPNTRLMMSLISLLFFFFGVLLIIHELFISALVGLICIWSAMTISVIPMWNKSDENEKMERMLHLLANVTVIGGMLALIGMHNSMM